MFQEQYQTIESSSVKVLQRNQELLFFFYKNFGKKLMSWTVLENDTNQTQSYIQSYLEFAKKFKICPNLLELSEILILSISFHVQNHNKKILTFQQFNSFIFAIAKYCKEKYKDVILKDENEFLLDLIHFMQNNNLDQQIVHQNNNIIMKILRNNVLERIKQNDPLVNHVDIIFNIFCNEFCKVGNPTLFLDKSKLYTMDCFAKHRSWIDRYPIDSDFGTFLSLMNYVMQEKNLDIQNLQDLQKFIQTYDLDWQCLFNTKIKNKEKVQSQRNKEIKFLFDQNANVNKKMSIMDFVLFCKDKKIIPQIINNKNSMILFLSVKLHYMQKQQYSMQQILDQKEWLTINYKQFFQILCIMAEGFTKEVLQISTQEKLRTFFEYFKIQLIFQY